MKRALLTWLCCLAPVLATAQAPAAGPSMEETKAWLETEGLDLMQASRLTTRGTTVMTADERVTLFTLDNCTLFWRETRARQTGSLQSPTDTWDSTVALTDLNLGSLAVVPDTLLTDNPVYAVRLTINENRSSPIMRSDNGNNPTAMKAASLPARTMEDGQRIANAIRHAVTLCGGKSGPF